MSENGSSNATPYRKILDKAFAKAIPLSAQFEITYRCNHKCTFCYNAPVDRDELTTEQIFDSLRKIRDLGVLYVVLTGGEPLCHPDFWDIGREVRRLGMAVRVYSNGYLLALEKNIKRLEDLNPVVVEVSLHGATAETHEALTRIKGSFEKTTSAIRKLVDAGFNVQIKCPITHLNKEELHGVRRLADDLGVFLIFDPVITPKDDGDLAPLSLRADENFFVRYWTELYPELHHGKMPPRNEGCEARDDEAVCGAGRTGFTIDPYGWIYPCVALRRKAGNILEIEDLKKFWGESVILNDVRNLAVEARDKLNAHENAEFFTFCMGVAETQTGNPLAMYPQAELNAEAVKLMYDRQNKENPDGKTA